MVNEVVCRYLRGGLAATPVVLVHLLEQTTAALWDRRPDPERFTIREVAAHLADWEGIWIERLQRIRTKNAPLLPDRDPEPLAQQNDYARADVRASLRRFKDGRADLLNIFESLELPEWNRIGRHETAGILNIQDLGTIILGHDNYHLRQVAEWIKLTWQSA